MNNVIPPITHELGKYWDQPSAERILIDDEVAMMDQKTFDALAEYSTSMPSGVYEGKMWKQRDRKPCKGPGITGYVWDFADTWTLCWFGVSEKPGMVSNNYRPIEIIVPVKIQHMTVQGMFAPMRKQKTT